MDSQQQRLEAMWANETDPVEREAHALAKRAGFTWYHTESSARQMARHAASEILELRRSSPSAQPKHHARCKTVMYPGSPHCDCGAGKGYVHPAPSEVGVEHGR